MSGAASSRATPKTALPSFAEAARMVAARAAGIAAPGRSELVALAQAAGRILAEPVMADQDQPSFTRSTRDGFACRAAEASSHAPLRLTGRLRAGDPPAGSLAPETAWEVMTGAPLPQGADAVIMLEHVEATDTHVRLTPPRAAAPGDNLVERGAHARGGQQLLAPGTRITYAQIALAAGCGYASLRVFPRPRVAILATGDELVAVDALPAPGQIRNSNAPMLAAMVAAMGGEPWVLPVATDDPGKLDESLALAEQAQMLLISGGVSAGKFDLVEPALARRGACFHFTGVRIQPGKPVVFGELPGRTNRTALPFFGLPGNPISSAVTFLLFGAPALAALAGSRETATRMALARLAPGSEVPGKPGFTRFLPAYLESSAHTSQPPQVTLIPTAGSGNLAALALSNCFVVVPEDSAPLGAGQIVRVLLP